MAAAAFLTVGLLQASLTTAASVSRQIQLGSDEYFLPPTPAWKFDSWSAKDLNGDDEFVPLTVVTLEDKTVKAESIVSVLDKYNATDDVWTSYFTEALYIQTSSKSDSDDLTKDLSPDFSVSTVFHSGANTTAAPGPYFVHRYTGDVYEAYKLYIDTNQAFVQSSYQDPHGTHHPLRAAGHSAGGLTIAVPSRLYFTATKDKPLAGLRIAVKDLYDLKGMKTSGGNRALFEISQPKTETAVSVQKLIDAGAIIVGKNKLSEFAFAGPFVPEHIDYLLPFNPRGDGYNSPGDSSGGSAACIAAYDWLDASMGSDTGGSIRGPASGNGIHGNRPTQDAVNLTGALVLSSAMDTSGMFARDPVVWSKVNKALYAGNVDEYNKYPKSIYLDPNLEEIIAEFNGTYPELQSAVEGFLDALTNITSGKAVTFNVDEAWNASIPTALADKQLAPVVNRVYGNLTTFEQWDQFGRDFVKTYMESHDGDFPHMSPGTREGWLRANATYTEAYYKRDLEIKELVVSWSEENFLIPDDTTCSESIYLYFGFPPGFLYKPDVSQDSINPYIEDLLEELQTQSQLVGQLNQTLSCSNTTLGDPEACSEITAQLENQSNDDAPSTPVSRFASIAGLPDYAVTLGSFDLGELTYSNSTLKTQSLPLSVDIVAAKGCDFMILNLVEELYNAGVVKKAKTGSVV